jgi:hypothetical protein
MKHILLLLILTLLAFAQDGLFVLCEGNYGSTNASLWSLDINNSSASIPAFIGFDASQMGDTGQSMKIVDSKMYVCMNNSHSIEIFSVTDNANPTHVHTIDVSGVSPRYLAILDNSAYVTSWNLNAILKINLDNYQIEDTINVNGMPEDILTYDGKLYVSLTMNADWSSSNQVLELANTNGEWSTLNSYNVIPGPGRLLIHDDNLYIASTYYNDAWETFAGTSRINLLTGDVLAVDYGLSYSYGGDLAIMNNSIYRSTFTGAAMMDDSLQLVSDGEISDMENVYMFSIINDNFYFGLTDYVAPDNIRVYNADGEFINNFVVGALPTEIVLSVASNAVAATPLQAREFEINGNYPNPFNPNTMIDFEVEKETRLSAHIIDINGHIISEYPTQTFAAGHYSINWNGLTFDGEPLPSGIYFVKIFTNNSSDILKITLLR